MTRSPHTSEEVSIEIAPTNNATGADDKLAGRVDALLRRIALIARWLTSAEQAALKLWLDEDAASVWKYYSLGEKYRSY